MTTHTGLRTNKYMYLRNTIQVSRIKEPPEGQVGQLTEVRPRPRDVRRVERSSPLGNYLPYPRVGPSSVTATPATPSRGLRHVSQGVTGLLERSSPLRNYLPYPQVWPSNVTAPPATPSRGLRKRLGRCGPSARTSSAAQLPPLPAG